VNNSVVEDNMGDRMVFADVRDMQGQHLVDARMEERALGLKMAEMVCDHMAMQYSVRMGVAAAVLDPWCPRFDGDVLTLGC
jgi:hypothetical protein